MVTLPDEIKVEMHWKNVQYIKGNRKLVFDIEPMVNYEGIIYFPNEEQWKNIKKEFSMEERLEIIFLLERINWKRKIKILVLNIPIKVIDTSETIIQEGTLESTVGGRKIEADNLFDPTSQLTIEQVHEIYFALERKFAESAKGIVTIYESFKNEQSVINKISLPTLEKNPNVTLKIVNK